MSNRIAIARWVILAALVAASLACSWIPFVGGGEDDPANVSDAEYFKSVAYTPQPAPSGPTPRPQEVIYDRDSNQLIDIQNLDQLNAVRYDLNGDGIPSDELAYWQAFPGGRPGMGAARTAASGTNSLARWNSETPIATWLVWSPSSGLRPAEGAGNRWEQMQSRLPQFSRATATQSRGCASRTPGLSPAA